MRNNISKTHVSLRLHMMYDGKSIFVDWLCNKNLIYITLHILLNKIFCYELLNLCMHQTNRRKRGFIEKLHY